MFAFFEIAQVLILTFTAPYESDFILSNFKKVAVRAWFYNFRLMPARWRFAPC